MICCRIRGDAAAGFTYFVATWFAGWPLGRSGRGSLSEIAQHFDAQLVEQIARRWLAWVPDPLTVAERAAGYPWRLSIHQAEFSDNVIFHRTEVLNRVYEDLLRDHLHLGRPDMLKVVFDRQIRRNTPGTFKTRLLRQGVVSCLKVFYKPGAADRGLRE
ncbi:MAG TPA: hypothetical protein VFV05_00680 [Methylomirabilota bacterium]|nr:hypothetical protein [Methylomirabilota bacterium]